MVTESKEKKKKKNTGTACKSPNCTAPGHRKTQHLQGVLVAILSLPSLVTMVCAFDSTYHVRISDMPVA